jgi:hypothetical protein
VSPKRHRHTIGPSLDDLRLMHEGRYADDDQRKAGGVIAAV